MTKALKVVIQLDECAKVGESSNFAAHNVAGFVFINEAVPGVRLQILDRKRKAPVLSIDARYYCVDLLALL